MTNGQISEEEVQPELEAIDNDFGTGMYINWDDGQTRTVVITEWGSYRKETKAGEKIAFRATVLNADGVKYNPGEKVIDTTSINFHIAIKPFCLEAQKEKQGVLCLKISRKGREKQTTYFMERLDLKEMGY